MIVFLCFQLPSYSGRNFNAVVSLLLMYGWSITPVMYPFSFLFDVPSTAYITLISGNLFVGLTGTLTTFTLELFPDDPTISAVNGVLKWLLLVFPNYCLGRGMMDLARNEYTAQLYALIGTEKYNDPFSFDIIGRNLLFMFILGSLSIISVIALEYWSVRVAFPTKNSTIAQEKGDDDVEEERRRVLAALPSASEDLLIVKVRYFCRCGREAECLWEKGAIFYFYKI